MMELNCIVIDDEPFGIAQVENVIDKTPGIRRIKSFDNAFDAMTFLHTNGKIDVVFTDISMPFINGIEAAAILSPYCQFLIFITAHRDYAQESYEVNADGYLLKPLNRAKFLQQVEKMRIERQAALLSIKDEKQIFLKANYKNTYVCVLIEEILYITAERNYIRLTRLQGSQQTYMGINVVEKALIDNPGFIKVNRSSIIAVGKIHHIDGYVIYMVDGVNFTVGKLYKNKFNDFIQRRTLSQ